ncbi:MAG TPA: Crp/Fnr family transcriptional regulator [Bacillota bacterium]
MEVAYRGVAHDVLPRLLPEATLRRLERHAVIRRYAFGERIPHGDPEAEQIHYIRSGRVRVVLHGPGGQDKILAILDRGALVGDTNLLPRLGRSVSCIAAELTETWAWPRSLVFSLMREDGEIAALLLASLARKIDLLTAQVHALTFWDAAERVVRTFIHLAQMYGEPDAGGSTRIALRLTQAEVGEIACASRVTVNKIYQRLKAERLMSKRGGHFIIHDLDRLSRWSGKGRRAALLDAGSRGLRT